MPKIVATNACYAEQAPNASSQGSNTSRNREPFRNTQILCTPFSQHNALLISLIKYKAGTSFLQPFFPPHLALNIRGLISWMWTSHFHGCLKRGPCTETSPYPPYRHLLPGWCIRAVSHRCYWRTTQNGKSQVTALLPWHQKHDFPLCTHS